MFSGIAVISWRRLTQVGSCVGAFDDGVLAGIVQDRAFGE